MHTKSINSLIIKQVSREKAEMLKRREFRILLTADSDFSELVVETLKMKIYLSIFLVLAIFVNFSENFGASLTHILNLRCTLADSYLKEAFQLYDRFVISSKTVSFYFYAKDAEAEKISKVNDTYIISGFDSSKPTRYCEEDEKK